MIRNYFKIAFRNLWKNKGFSAINILGLALGIACALMIILHVKEELSYDKGYSNANRLFRVTMQGKGEDNRHWAATAPELGAMLKEDFPEVKGVLRFFNPKPLQVLSYNAPAGQVKRFEEKGGLFAEASTPEILQLEFISGNPATALLEPGGIVLTEKTAQKYFGNEDPLGKAMREEVMKATLHVTGVIKKSAHPSHLQFDFLVSMPTLVANMDPKSLTNRTWNGFYNYVLLDKPESRAKLEAGMNAFTLRFYANSGEKPAEILANRELRLQPVKDIHLHSGLEKEMSANSDIRYVYIFSAAALFILLIAAMNFINISTAQAIGRTKEIGLRKVIGAGRAQLVRQFLGESILITVLSAILALVFFRGALPFYNNISGQTFHFEALLSISNISILLLLIVIIGILAGLYPAWIVSGFNPVTALKTKKFSMGGANFVRKGLIVFQFTISVFMIFSTVVMYRQMRLFHNKDLGFDKEQLIAIKMYDDIWKQYGSLANKLSENAGISAFGITSNLPGERFSLESFTPLQEGKEANTARAMWADENLLNTLGVKLAAGANFQNQFPEIKHHQFILNEAAVKAFGLSNPVGSQVILGADTGAVVGLIKDFNFASLHAAIDPLIIQYKPFNTAYLVVKARAGQVPQTLAFIETEIKKAGPSSLFTYTFIDDTIERLYASENRMMQVFKAFSAFAIFVSCLGLFGLAAYASRLRVKEIGIRKVLGATTSNVTFMLSKDFMKLVIIAMFIAWPLSWWVMTQWLEGFAYRVQIDGWVFIVSGSLAFLVAVLTVSFQALKAAIANPVRNLRAE